MLITLLSAFGSAVADPPVIVAFGDSITLGPGMQPGETYPEQLQALLVAKLGDAAPQVINAGQGGNTVLAGLSRMERDVLARHPRFVLIGFGMNDSAMRAANEPKVAPDVFREKLGEMIARVRAIGAQTILATLTPVVEEYYFERHPRDWYPDGLKADLARYDAAIKSLAEETQSPLVDLSGLDPAVHIRLPENTGLRDGVHPTAAGYGVIAAAYAQVLLPLLSVSRGASVCPSPLLGHLDRPPLAHGALHGEAAGNAAGGVAACDQRRPPGADAVHEVRDLGDEVARALLG